MTKRSGKSIKVSEILVLNPIPKWQKDKGMGHVAILECKHAVITYPSAVRAGRMLCTLCAAEAKAKKLAAREAAPKVESTFNPQTLYGVLGDISKKLSSLGERITQLEDVRTAPNTETLTNQYNPS